MTNRFLFSLCFLCLLGVSFVAALDVLAEGYSIFQPRCGASPRGTSGGCNWSRGLGYGSSIRPYQVYRFTWNVHAEGHGTAGPAGGKFGLNVCLTTNGSMWDPAGRCIQAVNPDGAGHIRDGAGDFSGDLDISSDWNANYKYANAEEYLNDAYLDSGGYEIFGRLVSIDGFNAPNQINTGQTANIDWNTDLGDAGSEVTLFIDGPSSVNDQSDLSGNDSLSLVGTAPGVIDLELKATGPSGDGLISLTSGRSITVLAGVFCGNGIIEAGEQCDNGGGNGACPSTCSNSCRNTSCGGGATCGNNVVESGEECDTGVNNGSCPRSCSNSCTNNTCVGNPPACNMSFSPSAVAASGNPTTASWSSARDADGSLGFSCTGNIGSGAVPATGSAVVNPTTTQTCTLTAANGAGTVDCSATVTVAQPPTCSLVFNPATVANAGDPTTATWTSNGDADGSIPFSCTGNLGSGLLSAPTGAGVVNVNQTQTCTLTVTNVVGANTCQGTVTVAPIVANNPPEGWLEAAVCTGISGWALDRDTPDQSIAVHLYRDGPAGIGTLVSNYGPTDIFRSDVNDYYTNIVGIPTAGNHGFAWSPIPASLFDGVAHQIYVHAVDSGGGPNPLLSGVPLPLQCTQPAPAVVSGLPACSNGPYNATFSWAGGSPGRVRTCPTCAWFNGFVVDIATDAGFSAVYNKAVPTAGPGPFGTDSIGFLGVYPGQSSTLSLNPGVNYYARVYNGVFGVTDSFSVPSCSLNVAVTATPNSGSAPLSPAITADVSGNVSGGVYQYQFDCNNDGDAVDAAIGETIFNSSNTTETRTCIGYGVGSHTARVFVTHIDSGSTAVGTAGITVAAPPPILNPVTVIEPNYCVSGNGATITWIIQSGGPQQWYEVQIDDDPAFGSPLVATGQQVSPINTLNLPNALFPQVFPYNTTLRTRVRVGSPSGGVSAWTVMNNCSGPGCQPGNTSWRTPAYAYPDVSFVFSPTNPARGVPIQFTDTTVFNGPVAGRAWLWNFNAPPVNPNPPTPPTAAVRNPVATYTSAGDYFVTLTATDAAGQSCTLNPAQALTVQKPIPVWKEILPR